VSAPEADTENSDIDAEPKFATASKLPSRLNDNDTGWLPAENGDPRTGERIPDADTENIATESTGPVAARNRPSGVNLEDTTFPRLNASGLGTRVNAPSAATEKICAPDASNRPFGLNASDSAPAFANGDPETWKNVSERGVSARAAPGNTAPNTTKHVAARPAIAVNRFITSPSITNLLSTKCARPCSPLSPRIATLHLD
jgi:hypothetical protein